MNKLKVLMCSEASFINSGFGIYAKELLSRLHKSNKYHIAEFASYGFVNDPRDTNISWRYYANAVKVEDPRYKDYTSRTDNQFGRWRFDKTLIDFRPDVVIDVRDYWMSYYQQLSSLRKYFHWILMPTVDSAPQQEDWIDTFLSADAIFTYSDWGAEVLKNQSSNKINYIDTTSPGVDLDVFKPKDNIEQIKQILGVPTDSMVVGSVMRNQKRKLIPELMIAFRKYLDQLEVRNPEEGANTILYLHTSYPDAGWDIPELLKKHRLCNKVYFTYVCANCNHVKASTYSHPTKICDKCGKRASKFASVTNGVSSDTLAHIYNIFDIYVQYAICEGFGMPQVEAAACGVPVAAVNYSAMCDTINKIDAFPIEVGSYFTELETKATRVYPNNDSLISIFHNYLSLPKPIRDKKRSETRRLTEKHYNWDNIAAIWMRYLDQLDSSGYRADWNVQPTMLSPIDKSINCNGIYDMIRICDKNLNNVDFISSMHFLSMLNDAGYGFSQSGASFDSFEYKDVVNNFQKIISNNNQSEHVRSNNIPIKEDFIEYAHMKEKLQ
jgi:glycosyltransferase involved in cell wall biosynthesis